MSEGAFAVTVMVETQSGDTLLAPTGLSTPHALSEGCTVTGGAVHETRETSAGQWALVIVATGGKVELRYDYVPGSADYPDQIWAPRDTRFTRAADALVAEARAIAPDAPPDERACDIACAVAGKFTYGHPDRRFYEGADMIPALGCGLTEGSCVDINAYFMASLRASGIEAGYVTGVFFPAEKGDRCDDMHCWVVTRAGGITQAWDIAHHLKLGTRDIRPALNPKPGFRVALAHSMGLDFPELGLTEVKLLSEPLIVRDGQAYPVNAAIRLHRTEAAAE